jgi:hypothetical protein
MAEFEIARGTPLPLTTKYTQFGQPLQGLANCRVYFVAKINQSDLDSAAVSALDNQALGGVIVLPTSTIPVGTPPIQNPFGNITQLMMPAAATYPLPQSVDRICYEIWVTQPGAIPWRAERGTILLTGRAQQAQP